MKEYIIPQIKVKQMLDDELMNVTSLPIIDEEIDDENEILSNSYTFDSVWDE